MDMEALTSHACHEHACMDDDDDDGVKGARPGQARAKGEERGKKTDMLILFSFKGEGRSMDPC